MDGTKVLTKPLPLNGKFKNVAEVEKHLVAHARQKSKLHIDALTAVMQANLQPKAAKGRKK